MITRLFFLLTTFLLPILMVSQNLIQNYAFEEGEVLKYKLFYNSSVGAFHAGNAVVEVRKDTIGNKPAYHFVGTGETNNFFDVFYKVRDKFQSIADSSSLLPNTFIRNTREGNFVFDDTVCFDREKDSAYSLRKKLAIPSDAYDFVCAVYFMRTLTEEDFGEDSIYRLHFYLDDSVYSSIIKYEGKGIVETEWGYLPCLKVKPMLITGEVFTNRYPMAVWITDDENHIPVLGESEIIVGSVKMELSGFEGLKNPFVKALTKIEAKQYR